MGSYSTKGYELTKEEFNYLLPSLKRNQFYISGDKYYFIGDSDDLEDMLNRLKGHYDFYDKINPMISYHCFKEGNLNPFREHIRVNKSIRFNAGGKLEDNKNINMVSKLSIDELHDYIQEKYIPEVKSADLTFLFTETGFDYDLNDSSSSKKVIDYYEEQSDFNEESLNRNTNYKVDGWEIVRKEIDPETDEEYDTSELEELVSDNTYNFGYLGVTDVNWRLYYDNEYEVYLIIMHPHLGGDPRGNYGKPFIIQGDDKDELLYRFYSEFLSGTIFARIELNDGSVIKFESTQDSKNYKFQFDEESSEIDSELSRELVNDFESFGELKGDEFIEIIIDKYQKLNPSKNKFSRGGGVDDAPSIYVEILGTGEGKWMSLEGMSDGDDVMTAIQEFYDELNEEDGGNREEYRIADMEGFGHDVFYSEYMGESDFDDLLEAYELFEKSDFPYEVVRDFANEKGVEIKDAISSMNDAYYGAYDSLRDFAHQMVDEGVYTPSVNEMYVTGTDKRIISGEEADNRLSDMSYDEIIQRAEKESEFEEKESDIQDKINSLEDEKDSLESSLDLADADDIDFIQDSILEKQEEIEELEDELSNLKETFSDSIKDEVHTILYDETYEQLENDLEGFLKEFGYEKPTDASFVSIDYDEIADTLKSDYSIIYYDRKYYIFIDYKNGGRIKSVGQAKDYNYYVVETVSKKIISGHDTKKEANEHKEELLKNNKKIKLVCYPRSTVEIKYNIDTTSKKSFTDIESFKYGGDVALRSNKKESDYHLWKTKKNVSVEKKYEQGGDVKYTNFDTLDSGYSSEENVDDKSDSEKPKYSSFDTFEKGGQAEPKLSYDDFIETLQEYEIEGGFGKTLEKGFEMYYLPKNSRFLGRKFKHRDKKKAYAEYSELYDSFYMENGGHIKPKDKRLITTHRALRNVSEPFRKIGAWAKRQWLEADFGDGAGGAKFYREGGSTHFISPHVQDLHDYIRKAYTFVIPRGSVNNPKYTFKDFSNDISKTFDISEGRNKIVYDYLNHLGDVKIFDYDTRLEERMSSASKIVPIKFDGGGEVEFIEYNGEEIMYSPHFETYYVNDSEFKTLEEAKEFIDKGSPTPDWMKEAYRRGLYGKGGDVKMPKSLEKRIMSLNGMIQFAIDNEILGQTDFGSTVDTFITFTEPITIKGKYVYVKYEDFDKKVSERFNTKDYSQLDELKWLLSKLRLAIKKGAKSEGLDIPEKFANGGSTYGNGGYSVWERNGFTEYPRTSPKEYENVEWSLNGHSPSFLGKMYFQKGTGFMFIEKENGDIFTPKSSNKLFWRKIKGDSKYSKGGSTYAEGGEIKTLWKIPIEKGTGKLVEKPILLKKGTNSAIKRWLNKNRNEVEDGWSGIQEWHETATVEEVEKYNMSKGGSTYAEGGKISQIDELLSSTDDSNKYRRLTDIRKKLLHKIRLSDSDVKYLEDNGIDTYRFAKGGSLEEQNKHVLENKTIEIQHHAEELDEVVSKTKEVPAWVVSKATRVTTDLSDMTHFLDGEVKRMEKYFDGGTLELPIDKAKKIFHLPLESSIYVPSTKNVNETISPDELQKRVDEVKDFIGNLFGGYTSNQAIGGFVDSQGELVNEDVVKVTSFAEKDTFEKHKETLLKKLSQWAKDWGQEAIGYEFEGDLYYVPENYSEGGSIYTSSGD